MKLDKITFARVVKFITELRPEIWFDIEELDDLIDIEVPAAQTKASCADVDELLKQLNDVDGFIPAVKAYRVLTGAGLKESKEAIEKYRSIPNFPKKDENAELKLGPKEATLSDILHSIGRTKAGDNIG